MQLFIHFFCIMLCLYTGLHNQIRVSSNFLAFHLKYIVQITNMKTLFQTTYVECISTKPRAKCRASWESKTVREKRENMKKHLYLIKEIQQRVFHPDLQLFWWGGQNWVNIIRRKVLAIYNFFSRCPWCNVYRRRKWTQQHEFNSWTSLIAFHIALILLGKVWIQLFSLQLWVNSRAD